MIPNLDKYNEGMRKSILDKLFFIPYVGTKSFVDFGCADGTLLSYLYQMFPESRLFGIDNNDTMIELADEKLKSLGADVTFFFQFSDWWNHIKECDTLILSSVIHEIYSYCSLEKIDEFWSYVYSGGFKYIAIRDLGIRKFEDKPSNVSDISKILRHADRKQLTEFEDTWGTITNNKNLLHFLLKYKWTENWRREVKENYLGLYIEDFLAKIPDNYTIDYFHEFNMPETKMGIMNDFHIDLRANTHYKCILRKI